MTTAEEYIARVLDRMPRDTPMREQIALELRGHIAERVAGGRPLAEVLQQLGDTDKLAESYLAAVPLDSAAADERILAKLVDAVVSLAMVSPIVIICWLILPSGSIVPVLLIATLVLGSCILGIYTAIAEATTDQTVGKRMMRLRVVRESGTRISGGQAVVRQLPIVLQVIWVDALFALFTDRSQRAFEMLSKTRVVRVPARQTQHSPLEVAS
jgi:uncharacterized RDD family membrane protein YckC